MKTIERLTENNVGEYAKCIESEGGIKDWTTSILKQSERACEEINKDENFSKDFAILSFSQGGLIARYIIETCKMKGTVKKWVSIGGPLMGTSKIPHCINGIVCFAVNQISRWLAYFKWAQNNIGPAGYFRDNYDLNRYYRKSNFLPQLNNEDNIFKDNDDDNDKKINKTRFERFTKLDLLVLVMFQNDTMIYPKETAWFQEVNEKGKLIDLEDSEIYKNDTFGLRTLDKENKIKFYSLEGQHLYFTYSDLYIYAFPFLTTED
jgi:palmitoyl-protein thioesterase